jgi:hypothetical protein
MLTFTFNIKLPGQMCIFLRRHITIHRIKHIHKTTLVSPTTHKFAVPIIHRGLHLSKAPYTLSVKLSDFTVWRHTWRKNWVNCAVLTGNSAGLRIVLSSRLSHTELRSSLRESDSFLSLPADTTMASSQGTQWASHDIFLFKYHFLLHILRFLFFFSDNTMANVVSKQKKTALFLSTIVTRTRRHTELPKKWKT